MVNTATRAEVYSKALSPLTGWMTRDEVRRLENLAPEERPTPAPAPALNGAVELNGAGVG